MGSRVSKIAMRKARVALRKARVAMKKARVASKATWATYKTDKGAVVDACPWMKPAKKSAKPCSAKGFKESKGYISVHSAYRKVELIARADAERIGTYVFRGEWLQKTEGERQEEYHREMCEAIKPEFCGGKTCPDRRGAHVDPTCQAVKGVAGVCDPRGRPEGQEGTHYADNNAAAHYVFCMDPICAQVCAGDENCKSYRTSPAHRFCELYRGSEPERMPPYGAKSDNWLVPQDGIFCVKK